MRMTSFSVLIAALLSQMAFASNYPPEYFYQTVTAVHRGPALIAHVGSGTLSGDVIGYKPSGILARNNPDRIDAIVVLTCNTGAGRSTYTFSVALGREYHGNGYLSDGSLDLTHLSYDRCFGGSVTFSLAFSDGYNHWDSNYGQNYPISLNDLNPRNPQATVYHTREGSGFNKINLKAWDFIVNQLRQ